MYRQYEDPRALEKRLAQARERLQEAQEMEEDIECIISLSEDVAELEERVNFAWQDDEYDSMNTDPADEEWMYENCY